MYWVCKKEEKYARAGNYSREDNYSLWKYGIYKNTPLEVNPPESKLTKRTSVDWFAVCSLDRKKQKNISLSVLFFGNPKFGMGPRFNNSSVYEQLINSGKPLSAIPELCLYLPSNERAFLMFCICDFTGIY